jgi:hypothetical protein
MKYDKAYFLAKFEAIPEQNWCSDGTYTDAPNRFCAFGHCGDGPNVTFSEESDALRLLMIPVGNVADINDGLYEKYQQPSAKQRILAALNDVP